MRRQSGDWFLEGQRFYCEQALFSPVGESVRFSEKQFVCLLRDGTPVCSVEGHFCPSQNQSPDWRRTIRWLILQDELDYRWSSWSLLEQCSMW